MPDDSVTSQAAALQIIQQEVSRLIHWAEGSSDDKPIPLQLVFDRVHLTHGQPNPENYRPAWALEAKEEENTLRIPYPQSKAKTEAELDELKQTITEAVKKLGWQDPFTCQNLSQLTLFLEKFGSHLSFGESDIAFIALIDQAKSDAAVAAAFAQSPDGEFALVAGDLMGVQKFIYTISSEGALKSLRARSFYLELATEEVVQQLLTALNLPRTNVIYSGASKFYLLVAATDDLENTLQRIQADFNNWLLETFQRKVFLAIAHEPFLATQLETPSDSDQPFLAKIWQRVNDNLTAQASRKFEHQLDRILKKQPSYQTCKVCHRDDLPEDKLKPLKDQDDSTLACPICRAMYQLGDRLPDVTAFVRSPYQSDDPDEDINVERHYYRAVESDYPPKKGETIFQINNWNLKCYPSDQFVPLLLGRYFRGVPNEKNPGHDRFMTASEMAAASEGIKRVGYLRMDVDRLGQIFAKGLEQAYTLPRLASLSRQMTYFFKVYLNSLAESRQPNFLDYCDALPFQRLPRNPPKDPHKELDKNLRQNLLFIYAGGDDLFVSGAWDEVVAFGFDVYQAFRAYTGNHPDITLSAGISIVDAKFPLYQAAAEAGEIEKVAKKNGRDSLGLFDAAFKWDEWLGKWNLEVFKPDDLAYLNSPIKVTKPTLFGVFPFIKHLSKEVGQGYTRSFVRNLLNTAQLQEAKIREAQEKQPDQVQDIRYYLHLPRVAYTLARLPSKILNDSDFRQSLKSPYNAPYFRAIATWIELLNR